jgi:hypothetical protein
MAKWIGRIGVGLVAWAQRGGGGEGDRSHHSQRGRTSLPKLTWGKVGRVKGIKWSELKVAMNRKRLGKEIGKVKKGGNIRKEKQTLTDSITEPVESHIHRFGLFRAHSSMGKANSAFVVTEYGCRGLRVANIL